MPLYSVASVSLPRIPTPNPSPSRYVRLGTTGVSQVGRVCLHTHPRPITRPPISHVGCADASPLVTGCSSQSVHREPQTHPVLLFFSRTPHQQIPPPPTFKQTQNPEPSSYPHSHPRPGHRHVSPGHRLSPLLWSPRFHSVPRADLDSAAGVSNTDGSSVRSPLTASHSTRRNFPATLRPSRASSWLCATAFRPPSSPTLLQSPQPPRWSANMPGTAPQNLCSYCFLCPGCSPHQRATGGHSAPRKREAFSDNTAGHGSPASACRASSPSLPLHYLIIPITT